MPDVIAADHVYWGGLGLPQEDHQVMLLLRVRPHEQAVPGPPSRLDDPFLDLHLVHVEQVIRLKFGDEVHA